MSAPPGHGSLGVATDHASPNPVYLTWRRRARRWLGHSIKVRLLLVFLPWVARSLWIYLQPRADGRPG